MQNLSSIEDIATAPVSPAGIALPSSLAGVEANVVRKRDGVGESWPFLLHQFVGVDFVLVLVNMHLRRRISVDEEEARELRTNLDAECERDCDDHFLWMTLRSTTVNNAQTARAYLVSPGPAVEVKYRLARIHLDGLDHNHHRIVLQLFRSSVTHESISCDLLWESDLDRP